jgi:hypothetical protein
MAEKLNRIEVAQKAVIHPELALIARHSVDRSFELPTALYAITAGLFLAYLGVMGFGFRHSEMVLPMAIFVFFIIAGFGIPALWVKMRPDNVQRALSWGRFVHEGIDTFTGRLDARAAAVQVLILPALIFLWGVTTVTIAAIVRG